jgi:hypothetical protein
MIRANCGKRQSRRAGPDLDLLWRMAVACQPALI